MFLLDTNVVSELCKVRAGRADPGVASWAASVPSARMFLSADTIHELEFGVLLAERADPAQGALLRRWLDGSVAPAFDQRVLPIDEVVARRAASLHVPDPAPFRDAFIGATALVHRLVLVARNARNFERLPDLVALNPWSELVEHQATRDPPGRHAARRPGLGFGIVAIAAAVVLAGAALLWMGGDSPVSAAQRIRDVGSPLVVEVLVHEDWFDGDSVTVIIVDPARDQDARTVWCTVVEPVVSPDDFRVAVANDHVWWNPPTDCADAKDVPAGVVQVEFQDLPGGPYSSP